MTLNLKINVIFTQCWKLVILGFLILRYLKFLMGERSFLTESESQNEKQVTPRKNVSIDESRNVTKEEDVLRGIIVVD